MEFVLLILLVIGLRKLSKWVHGVSNGIERASQDIQDVGATLVAEAELEEADRYKARRRHLLRVEKARMSASKEPSSPYGPLELRSEIDRLTGE